jgi:hypothetical protein
MKYSLSILAHDGAEQTVREFMPYWRAVDEDVVVYLPEGSRGFDFCIYNNVGQNAYRGNETLVRWAETVKVAAKREADFYIFAEYDTLPMSPTLPQVQAGSVNAAVVSVSYPGAIKFCLLSPLVLSKEMLNPFCDALMAQAQRPEPEWTIGGLTDRLLSEAAINAGLPLNNIGNAIGYLQFPDIHKMIVGSGANWVHGWKSLDEFGILL